MSRSREKCRACGATLVPERRALIPGRDIFYYPALVCVVCGEEVVNMRDFNIAKDCLLDCLIGAEWWCTVSFESFVRCLGEYPDEDYMRGYSGETWSEP